MMIGKTYFCEHVKKVTQGECYECKEATEPSLGGWVLAKARPKRKLTKPIRRKTMTDIIDRAKLEEILYEVLYENISVEEAIPLIQNLAKEAMLGLIGEDEDEYPQYRNAKGNLVKDHNPLIETRNQLKAELRKKLEGEGE